MSSSSSPAPTAAGSTPASCSELIPPSAKKSKKAPSLCDEHHEMVTIIMKSPTGKTGRKFIMYKSVACYYSPVLDKAFNGTFQEGQTQTMTIDDFQFPDTFGAVQSWMYTQKTDGWKEEWAKEYNARLYYVWVLAHRLIMPKLRSFLAESCAASTPDVFRNLDKQIWIDANVPSELLLDTLYVYCRADKPTKKDMKLEDYFVNVD
ncbi:hypothetical protein IFR04_000683 [Cadophora malorum]|uniref:BTB domain-containing protein n=1 Tax=Cadophora malorum TaxID=108018 RepID=A0A8H8BWA4_9HELO|nr:hypothetical protein IFR04_000683 [Cadophora malorum]